LTANMISSGVAGPRAVSSGLLFAALLIATMGHSRPAAGSTMGNSRQAQTIGYDCSQVDEVGLPFMPPKMYPQKVVARRIVFLERPKDAIWFYVGPEFDLDDGTRVLKALPFIFGAKATTDQLLKTITRSWDGFPTSSFKVPPRVMQAPANLMFGACDDAAVRVACMYARPLHSELPNALPARVAQRWEVWRSADHGVILGLGYMYRSDSNHYTLDSYGWLVPLRSRDDVISGLHAISKQPGLLFSSFLNGLQRGNGNLVEIPCAKSGSCGEALPLGTVVNSSVSESLVIQSVDELDYVAPPTASQLGFIYHVRSGQSYFGARSAMVALAGGDARGAIAKLQPYEVSNIFTAYEKDQTGWRISYGRCAGD
jgi:hypothetical protein